MKIKLIILLTAVLFVITANTKGSAAAGQAQQQRVPIELVFADSLNGIGPNVRIVSGHVKFIQGDVTATCDEATEYQDVNKVQLKGNVVITQQNLIFKAPLINYNGDTRLADAVQGVRIFDQKSVLTAEKGTYSTRDLVADFRGNVTIEDDSAMIWADRIVYYKSSRNSFAYGNVLIQGKFTNALLNSDTLEHYPGMKYTKAYGNPILYQIDTVESIKFRTTSDAKREGLLHDSISNYVYFNTFDTLSVTSDTMEANRGIDQEIYNFSGNVEITRGSVAALSSYAVYNKTAEIITLINSPIVWYDSTQLHGDSIIINIPGRKLSLIHSINNAMAESRSDTFDLEKINQIFSDQILITFANDSINGIQGYGNSKSLYFYLSDEGEEGASRVGCDTILIDFKNGEADNIKWLGAIQGEYIPHTMLQGSPKEYYLPYFKWNDNRPRKKLIRPRLSSAN